MELNDLKETITSITDPRRISYGNIRHKLDDIVIGLKENQYALYHDAELYFRDIPAEVPTFETLEKDYGRLEKRTYYLPAERAWEYGRISKKKMMFKAALNPQVLLDILFPQKK